MAKLSEKDIERYAGLSGIRRKPVVYAGSMDNNGLWTCWREPNDNTVDRALAGQNNLTHMIIDKQPNTYWVVDEGDGIPVGIKEFVDERGKREKLSTFYVVTGLTHGGSNFKGKEASRGTHGLGIKVTNALSRLFKVWTFRDGKWYAIEYSKGNLVKNVHKSKAPKLPHGVRVKSGTVVCFQPDLDLFSKNAKMPVNDAIAWCKLSSYLVPKLKVKFTNEKGKTTTYQTKRGLIDYLEEQKHTLKCEYDGKAFQHQSKLLDVVLAFSTAENDNVKSYTNGLNNIDGGFHKDALDKALFDSLKSFSGKKQKFKKDDLLEGLVGLVNAKLPAPMFSNQRKDALKDDRIYDPAYAELKKAFDAYFKANKSLAKRLCAKAMEIRTLTEGFRASKQFVAKVKKASKKQSAKLSDITGKCPLDKREIFLVEGDSAAGGVKQARDRDFQAVFPLKGKPLNVLKAKSDKINSNTEIVDLLAALGIDLSKNDYETKLRYGKIIILADADDDGDHIATLLFTFFWKFAKRLYKKGCIYIAVTPKFRCVIKGNTYFGKSKEKLREKYGPKADITYLKGLSELQPENLAQVACNPDTRKLIQLTYPKDKKSIKNFEKMMGTDKLYNKKLLGISRENLNG